MDRSQLSGRGLKVLAIDEEIPCPPDTGKRIRTWNLLRRLAPRHRISLLCYGERDERAISAIQSAGIDVHLVDSIANHRGWQLHARLFANLFSPYPYSVSKHYTRRFQRQLNLLLQNEPFDLLHCEWTPYARFLEAADRIRTLVSAHGVESQIWFRRARHSNTVPERIFFALQALKMRRFEQRALRRANWVTTVSPLDAETIRAWGAASISLVENGVDPDEFRPATEPGNPSDLLFVGSLDWFANQDGVLYLLEQIWPLIRSQQPQARLRIIGRRPPAQLEKRIGYSPSVELIGEVSDVRPFFSRAAVVVVPLRIGGGTRIKILEALSMGKAVVSTSVGAEGLAVVDGVHLLLADSPQEFARRAIDLLNFPEERRRLGENGRKLAVQRYSWNHLADRLELAWYRACGIRMPSFASRAPALEELPIQP